MIRSMTGFARREEHVPAGLLAWEIKTVNHRYLEISCRLPEEFRSAETDFRQRIASAVRRGKVECNLHFRALATASGLEIDSTLLDAVAERARLVAAQVGPVAQINAVDLLRWPGVVRDTSRDMAPLIKAADRLLGAVLDDLGRFRDSEGDRLRAALDERCAALTTRADFVAARLPEIRTRLRAKLLERISQLVSEVNHDRLEQELAIIAQRLDVDEELHRLRGHVDEVRNTFGSPDPAGRRLDFLMQELNREANTLSSKSQDMETTRAGVDMKVLIEQMREQVQNIE
jgi:uncharacterized protein (TIGR00255 family)